MVILQKYVIGTVSLLMSFFFYWLLYSMIRGHILEIGYRTKRKFKRRKEASWWEHYLLLDICKNARINKRRVWYFFTEFVFVCICALISVVMWILSPVFPTIDAVFCVQSGFGYAVSLFLVLVDVIMAQQFVPSEQKRHRPIPRFTKEK